MTIAIDDLQEKLDKIFQMLVAQMPTRHIKRSLLDYTEQDDTEILDGILTIVNAGEKDFKNQLGMIAKEGTASILLVAHIKVAEETAPQAIQTAELAFSKELKSAIRFGVPGIGLTLESVEYSRQLEHPYGWFVAFINAGPPLETLY